MTVVPAWRVFGLLSEDSLKDIINCGAGDDTVVNYDDGLDVLSATASRSSRRQIQKGWGPSRLQPSSTLTRRRR
jgi:hypothetical protein